MNLELAERVYKQIESFPESFYMGVWASQGACGTVACIAGHALLFSGYTVRHVKENYLGVLGEGYYTRPVFIAPDGTELEHPPEIAAAAREVMELSDEEWSMGARPDKRLEGLFFDTIRGKERLRALIEKARNDQPDQS